MKTAVAPFETAALCLRIVCTNGTTIRLTRYPFDMTMSNGQVYQTGSGFDFTGYSATASLSPSAIDLEGFAGYAGITRAGIASGVFDHARCYLFACNFLNPVEDFEPIVASILGKTTLNDERYVIEEMALIDALGQSVGKTYTAACGKAFGGQEDAGCKVVLGPLTVTGALTAVASAHVMTDSARGEASDYFGGGVLTFTGGQNAGFSKEVKSFAAGVIEVYEPFYYAPQVGDTYALIPGCRKRLEDCRDKWNNVVNFGGFSFVPTGSQYAQIGIK